MGWRKAGNGHDGVVYLLLSSQYKVDINALNNNRCTALMFAASRGYERIVTSLLWQNAKVDISGGINKDTALMLAARYGHYNIVDYLLRYRANPYIIPFPAIKYS